VRLDCFVSVSVSVSVSTIGLLNATTVIIVQIGETLNTELDSIIQQVKEIKYKGNVHSANVLNMNHRAPQSRYRQISWELPIESIVTNKRLEFGRNARSL